MYNIEITYDSGDSFGNYPNQKCLLELNNSSLSLAKENLQAIEEHSEMYDLINDHKTTRQSALDKYKDKFWYSTDYPEYSIKLKLDNGKFLQISVEWKGYFETLNFAEIIIPEDPQLIKRFNR